MTNLTKALFLICIVWGGALAHAQVPDPSPARFATEIHAFANWDAKNSFPKDAILFVGSSSIRLWATASAFPKHTIINRGFGGSHISDVNYYYDQLVKPYRAATIVLYAGDNDIAYGKTPERVLADFKRFVERVRGDTDRTKILFLSIKPSVARWHHWPTMVEANGLIENYVADQPELTFVDLASTLLDDRGQPKDAYVYDELHLNEYGYQLWNEALAPFLN